MVATSSRRGFLIAAALGVLAALTLGCVGDPGSQVNVDNAPRFGVNGDDFRPVSDVLERRCGNVDCHGSQYRAMRIYGKYGLRRPELPENRMAFEVTTGYDYETYYSGGIETTVAELSDNYDSVVALEPVLLREVIARESKSTAELPCPYSSSDSTMTPECLTLVRKPRLQEKHKGGKIWDESDKGDQCITLWILNNALYGDRCAEDVGNFNQGQ
jgi:hypothetical protein